MVSTRTQFQQKNAKEAKSALQEAENFVNSPNFNIRYIFANFTDEPYVPDDELKGKDLSVGHVLAKFSDEPYTSDDTLSGKNLSIKHVFANFSDEPYTPDGFTNKNLSKEYVFANFTNEPYVPNDELKGKDLSVEHVFANFDLSDYHRRRSKKTISVPATDKTKRSRPVVIVRTPKKRKFINPHRTMNKQTP